MVGLPNIITRQSIKSKPGASALFMNTAFHAKIPEEIQYAKWVLFFKIETATLITFYVLFFTCGQKIQSSLVFGRNCIFRTTPWGKLLYLFF